MFLARGAGDSIKPGVERSETPGNRNPKRPQPAERAIVLRLQERNDSAVGRSAGWHYSLAVNPGFRCAPPQALCYRPLRGLDSVFTVGSLLAVQSLLFVQSSPKPITTEKASTLTRSTPLFNSVSAIQPQPD